MSAETLLREVLGNSLCHAQSDSPQLFEGEETVNTQSRVSSSQKLAVCEKLCWRLTVMPVKSDSTEWKAILDITLHAKKHARGFFKLLRWYFESCMIVR